MRRRETHQYHTIKCSLSGVLINPSHTQGLIESRCRAVSEMSVNAYHLCREMIETLLAEEERRTTTITTTPPSNNFPQWPDFRRVNVFVQMMTKGVNVRRLTRPTPAIEWTWSNGFVQPPSPKRHCYDYSTIKYAATTFQTAFLNNLHLNFISRQRKAIREHLHHSTGRVASDAEIYALQTMINGWEYRGRAFNADHLAQMKTDNAVFVERHRRHLPVTPTSLFLPGKSDTVPLIRYYHFLRNDCPRLKNLLLVPRTKIKMHHATFDAVGIKGLCRDAGYNIPPPPQPSSSKDCDGDIMDREGWSLIFDMKKLATMKSASSPWVFDRSVTTDGVACSVRFRLTTTALSPETNPPVTTQERHVPNRCKRVKTNSPKRVSVVPDEATTNNANNTDCIEIEGKRIIGIDPGRKNVAFCVELDPTTHKIVKRSRLSSGQYYCDSGHNQRKKRVMKWLAAKDHKVAIDALANTTTFEDYRRSYMEHHQVIWDTRTTKKIRREKFRVWCLRQRTLDRFVSKVLGKESRLPSTHVAYGSASFSTSRPREKYTPPSMVIIRKFRSRVGKANLTLVDEWNTSRVCHRCYTPLSKVGIASTNVDTGEEKTLYLRGLRRCSAQRNDCPIGGAFVDRDSNAATNIAIKFLRSTSVASNVTVPYLLCRGNRIFGSPYGPFIVHQ